MNLISASLCRIAQSSPSSKREKLKSSFAPERHPPPIFPFFIYISPQFKMKTHYAAMHSGILHRAFIVLKKCCHCKTGFPLVILTPHVLANTLGVTNDSTNTHSRKMFRMCVCVDVHACIYSTCSNV